MELLENPDAYYHFSELKIEMRLTGGAWKIVPDQTLIDLLSGFGG